MLLGLPICRGVRQCRASTDNSGNVDWVRLRLRNQSVRATHNYHLDNEEMCHMASRIRIEYTGELKAAESYPAPFFIRILMLLCVVFAQPAMAFDCDAGIYPGVRVSNGTVLHSTCGSSWRILVSTPLKQDDDFLYGFANNSYNYMIGVGYRWNWKKLRLDAGLAYIDEETRLFLQHQGPIWLRASYQIFSSFGCGWFHSSVLFVDDSGRDQAGCYFSFDF